MSINYSGYLLIYFSNIEEQVCKFYKSRIRLALVGMRSGLDLTCLTFLLGFINSFISASLSNGRLSMLLKTYIIMTLFVINAKSRNNLTFLFTPAVNKCNYLLVKRLCGCRRDRKSYWSDSRLINK